jgi:sterol desaturase/sphingolipid hydroxylase (fatty acid hydroxylase superfamily)
MTPHAPLLSDLATSSAASAGVILVAMTLLALVEAAVPLHARGRWSRTHLGPNLALTFLTFATNAVFSGVLVMTLVRLETEGFGLLRRLPLGPWAGTVATVLALDLSFYVAHVAMHGVPALWRFHSVHHSDPAVDVTTTIRQHPGESVIRYAFLAAAACAIGAGPGAFAAYRLGVALSGLLEHANVRVPPGVDRALSLVFTWPGVHKVHHSRDPRFTDTNYGNLVSWWDRLFGTFTPTRHARAVVYGLDGLDAPATQTTAGLLALPFRSNEASHGAGPPSGSPTDAGSWSAGRPAVEVAASAPVADHLRVAQRERVAALSPGERVRLALDLGRRDLGQPRNTTGSRSTPCMRRECRNSGSPASSKSGCRARSSSKSTRASRRASGAPRHRCSPKPNARWRRLVWSRATSKRSASSPQISSSRFAEA